MCLSIFLIIIYLIIIIFNIYNSIYLSNKLKIADDPENGGKDQNYVDTIWRCAFKTIYHSGIWPFSYFSAKCNMYYFMRYF